MNNFKDKKRQVQKYSKGWNPYTSKWKAAMSVGMNVGLKGSENVLYLGASSGTTIGHLSSKTRGIIFGVEKAVQMAIPLVRLSSKLNNLAPMFCDANDIDYIKEHLYGENIDILFQDIPSIDQVNILVRASKLVDKDCKILLSLKTQSISQKDWRRTGKLVTKELKENFKILDVKSIEPYHQKHLFFVLKKK